MSDKVLELSEENFSSTIAEGVTLVDFWAPWCGPCRMMTPVIDQIADKFGDRATIAKLDIDQARGVASQFGISSIPAIFIFKDGNPVKQMVGMQVEADLVNAIEEALSAD